MDPRITRSPAPSSAPLASTEQAGPGGLNQGARSPAFRQPVASLASRGRSGAIPAVSQGAVTTRASRAGETQGEPAAQEASQAQGSRSSLGAFSRRDELDSRFSPDRRENDKQATIRESRWATGLWSSLRPEQLEPLMENVRFMVASARNFETLFHEFEGDLSGADRRRIEQSFTAARSLGARLDAWEASPDRSSKALCELLADGKADGRADFKDAVDGLETCIDNLDRHRTQAARGRSFFEDRGRMPIPKDQRREESAFSRHAGISDSNTRTRSAENFFSEDLEHYKGMASRAPDSRTARKFRESGTPFIGGASGSIENILLIMDTHKHVNDLSNAEYKNREKLLGLYTAMLVSAGHHSVMECMLPARAYGYFEDVPSPLKGGYTPAVRALANRLRELGLDAGGALTAG